MASPMEVNDGSEWELSKENVQPLRQGRKFANLAAALQPHTADQLAKIREERQQFEGELRTYSGEDPLEVWDGYIKWTEQNFPKGGKESNLLQILERCVTIFKDEPVYHNDPRYISAWIKFAGMCTDPLEIYSFLFNQNIGCKLAQLYESWAWELERVGNTKKADLVYTKGVQNGAQPLDQLQRRHSELQVRVARRMAGEMVDPPDRPAHTETNSQPQRGALGELKVKGKKGAVGSQRVGSARSRSSATSIGSLSGTQSTQQAGGIQIFCDENAPTPSLPPQTGQWSGLPSRDTSKENSRSAGVWTQARAKQRGIPNVPVSEVSSVSKPAFEIHEDTDAVQPLATPRKIQPELNQILSSKKPERNPDRFYHVQHSQSDSDPNQRPMYCKEKIYTGAEEFSFEELRAARWRERKRKADMMLWEDIGTNQKPMYCKFKVYGTQEIQFEELRAQRWLSRHRPGGSQPMEEETRQPQQQIQLGHPRHPSVPQLEGAHGTQNESSDIPKFSVTDVANKTRNLSLSRLAQNEKMPPELPKGMVSQGLPMASQGLPVVSQNHSLQSLQDSTIESTSQLLQHMSSGGSNPPTRSFTGNLPSNLPGRPSSDSLLGQPSSGSLLGQPSSGSLLGQRSSGSLLGQPSSGSLLGQPSSGSLLGQPSSGSLLGQPSSGSLLGQPSSGSLLGQPSSGSLLGQPSSGSLLGQPSSGNFKTSSADLSRSGPGRPMPNLSFKGSGGSSSNNNSCRSPSASFAGFSLNTTSADSSRVPDMSQRSSARSTPRSSSFMSPTVNTQAAMHLVMGMFNQTMNPKDEFGWGGDEEESADEGAASPEGPCSGAAQPHPAPFPSAAGFAIYDESTEKGASGAEVKDVKNTSVVDKENCPPSSSQRSGKRHGLGQILQPSFHDEPEPETFPVPQQLPTPVMTGDIYEVEMADMDEEEDMVGHRALAGRTMNMADNIDGLDPYNLTFAPEFSSTRNFSREAALLASTPMTSAPLMPAPPVSSIKPVAQQHQTINSEGELTSDSRDCTMENQQRRQSLFQIDQNLSPITENSEPSGSSLGSTNSTGHGHSTVNGLMMTSVSHHTRSHMHDTRSHMHDSRSQDSTHHDHSHASHKPHKAVGGASQALDRLENVCADRKQARKDEEEEDVADKTYHEIDISNFVKPDVDDPTEQLFNMSIAIDPSDPFDEDLIARFLSTLPTPIQAAPNYHSMSCAMPPLKARSSINIGSQSYSDVSALGKGAFATVFRAKYHKDNMELDKVIKVQQPACPWEFYITNELIRRMGKLQSPVDVASSIMYVDYGYFFTDGSFLVSDLESKGTLLDVANAIKQSGRKADEWLLIILLLEMLQIVQQMHQCKIIHGDIKPDNFLLHALPHPSSSEEDVSTLMSGNTRYLKLIDFGRSIDMRMYPTGTTFTAKVKTSGFQCIEMKTDRPWTYQTDLFGLVGTIYVLAFGEYMKVYQEAGRWRVSSSFKRRFKAVNLWQHLFDDLLNIPSSDDVPDLDMFRELFTQFLKEHPPTNLTASLSILEMCLTKGKN